VSTTHGTPPVVPPNATSPERKGRFWIGFGAGCLTSLVLALMLAGVVLIGSLVPAIGAARAAARTARGQAAAAPQGGGEALSLEELEIEGALENEDYDRAEEIARALESRSGTPEARALVFMVRIERAVAAEDARSADALVTECRELGLPVDPSSELGVAGLWLDDDEPAKCRAIAERVLLGEFDADEYGRYLRGTALVLRGLASAELGDADAGAKDITEAISLAPDEETADEWQGYLDEVRERTR
jgi:hypothetical protein